MAEMRAELVGLLIEKHGERAKIKLDKDKSKGEKIPKYLEAWCPINAKVGDVVGDRLLHNFLAVDRGSHCAAAGAITAAAHETGAESDAERNRSHALQSRALERGKFHVSSTFHDIASALLPAQAHRAHSRSLRGTPALPS